MKKNLKYLILILLLGLSAALWGCMATVGSPTTPSPLKKTGEAPKAAMLPIISSNDQAVSSHATGHLEKCLQDRNAFNFVPKEKVEQAVAAGRYDMTKIFGLSTAEYKALASALGVDYVLHGIVAVRKSLKFTGWRKDVDVYIKLYDGKSGESIDSWRSMTDFAFSDASTELDAKKMGAAAAAHICEKMGQSGF
ncbi:MAG: hypothetical protein A4E71_02343 [Smithella sp. PtaU1.Bin162]|nr:MAG: hypothetical protein A4E71_02343 [Smithella sp. PtaU1.Bin162]